MTAELIVDGNGLACRLWWAGAHNVPERFLEAILKVKPNTVGPVRVAWDSKTSWRRELLPTYKAHRPPKPQALLEALEMCRAACADDSLEADNYEADDVIATELAAAFSLGRFVVVMSDDKDMAQLVGPRCVWLAGGKVHNEGAVKARFGVPPARIRHLLSWMGDKVDGLPGVPGYGPKKSIARALAGEVGNQLTYDLSELALVPKGAMK
jgi:DNA polymerase I